LITNGRFLTTEALRTTEGTEKNSKISAWKEKRTATGAQRNRNEVEIAGGKWTQPIKARWTNTLFLEMSQIHADNQRVVLIWVLTHRANAPFFTSVLTSMFICVYLRFIFLFRFSFLGGSLTSLRYVQAASGPSDFK